MSFSEVSGTSESLRCLRRVKELLSRYAELLPPDLSAASGESWISRMGNEELRELFG